MATMARAHATGAQTTEQEQEPRRGASLLEEILEQTDARRTLEPLLPQGETLGRITALVALAQKKDPNLAKCTRGSLVDAVATILRWGLTIGETAYLVPRFMRKDGVWRCTAIADYKGLVHLMRLSKLVRGISYDCVYEGEEFEYENGAYPNLRHRPFSTAAEKKKLLGAYVVIRLPHNQVEITFMPVDEIDGIRQQYSQGWKAGACPPWYAIKTCFRRVAKLLPKDPMLAKAFEVVRQDEDAEYGAAEQLRALDELDVPSGPTFEDDGRRDYDADDAEDLHAHDFDAAGSDDDAAQSGLALDDAPRAPRRRDAMREG